MSLVELAPLFPLIFVVSVACVTLIVGLGGKGRDATLSYGLGQFGLVGGAVLAALSATMSARTLFGGMYVADRLAATLDVVVCLLIFGALGYSRAYLKAHAIYKSEYFVLALFGAAGMMIINAAGNFVTLYLGLELMSLSMYAMLAFQRDSARATEAAMKYFILGALASGLLLYGLSMLYGAANSLDIATLARATAAGVLSGSRLAIVFDFGLVFVVVGLAFKIGAVPFHMWVPDVYEGAPTAVTLYVSTAPKVAALAMFFRLLIAGLHGLAGSWQDMVIILSVLSMALGNLVAVVQSNLKRLLAYSAISHMGFALLGIAATTREGEVASLFYLIIYAIMGLGGFGLLALLSREGHEVELVDDLKGLNQRHPWYAFLMLLLMFAMAGVPPTAGFYAKLFVIQAAVNAHLLWLAVVAVLFSVIGAYYYLRVVKVMYFDTSEQTLDRVPTTLGSRVLFSVNGLSMILLTPWVGLLIHVCQMALGASG